MYVLSILTIAALSQFAPAALPAVRDAALADAAIRSVSTYGRYSVFDDVTVLVDGGDIVLTGKVTQPLKKDEIGDRVARLDGVRQVRNELEVLPLSIGDDRIRRSVARAIYGSPTFWRFAAMPNPPIHIVVENGRVTLTGVVPTNVERAVAQSLATGHGELSVHNRLKTDNEARSAYGARMPGLARHATTGQLTTGSS